MHGVDSATNRSDGHFSEFENVGCDVSYCEVFLQRVNFWQLEDWPRPAPPILFCLDDDAKVTT